MSSHAFGGSFAIRPNAKMSVGNGTICSRAWWIISNFAWQNKDRINGSIIKALHFRSRLYQSLNFVYLAPHLFPLIFNTTILISRANAKTMVKHAFWVPVVLDFEQLGIAMAKEPGKRQHRKLLLIAPYCTKIKYLSENGFSELPQVGEFGICLVSLPTLSATEFMQALASCIDFTQVFALSLKHIHLSACFAMNIKHKHLV